MKDEFIALRVETKLKDEIEDYIVEQFQKNPNYKNKPNLSGFIRDLIIEFLEKKREKIKKN